MNVNMKSSRICMKILNGKNGLRKMIKLKLEEIKMETKKPKKKGKKK